MQIPVIFLAFANDKVDNARYLRNLPKELDGIREALLPAVKANLCEVVERANVTIENMLDTFQDERYRDRIAILHYGGHADGYQLLLENLDGSHAVAQGGGLVSFFSKQKGLKLVFFNGCSTHQQSVELMQSGIPAVIGTSNAINDDIATDLSIRFYKGIAQGLSLDRAWNSGIDEIKIKKGEANTRGLYRKEAAEKMEDERFPWELLIREGSEIIKEFNLPSEVNNPLFGLPEIPKSFNLPELPYQFLMPYNRTHAEVLFGRAKYIRDLYNRITDKNSAPIITVCGQAGVGKSSLFDAGVVPRLEKEYVVKYIRRIQDKGLLLTLEDALGIVRTQEEVEELRQDAIEAGSMLIFEQKEVDSMPAFMELEVEKNEQLSTTQNPLPISKSYALTTNENAQTNQNEQTTQQQQLIAELKILAEKADANFQSTIYGFIETIEKQAVNHHQNGETQLPTNTNQFPVTNRLLAKWKQIEQESGKPLVIMLDQVEEVYTRPMVSLPEGYQENENTKVNIGEAEIQDFLIAIKAVFDDIALAPKGKLLLGFRKEFQPDFEEWLRFYKLPQNKVFIDILKRNEIIEVVQGLTTAERLQRNYRVSIESGLAEIIADDLLEDNDSAIAPVLQMVLTKLWKSCEKEDTRIFTIQKYQEMRREGLLMEDFVKEQLLKMKEWNTAVEQSGFVLDVLMQHTTRFGTAGTQSLESLKEIYAYKAKTLLLVLEKAKELYLLVDLGKRTGLAHDTLAPIIQEEYRKSMYPAQRARRLLDNKIVNFVPNDKKSSVLDERELGVVEDGKKGMTMLNQKELDFIAASQKRRKINKTKRLWRRIGFAASIVAIIGFAIYSQMQRSFAKNEQTRAEASQLLTLAVQNDDLTMALRLAERADSLGANIDDNSMKDKFIEILATNSFYYDYWASELASEKVCIDEEGSKFLFLQGQNLYIKNWSNQYIFEMEAAEIYDYDLSPDGKKILTSGSDYVIRLWDMNQKQLLALANSKENGYSHSVGFLKNGTGFYIFNDVEVRLIDFKGREFFKYKAKFPSETIQKISISPDGETMLISSYIYTPYNSTNELKNWDIKKNQLRYQKTVADYVQQIVFAPNSEQILLATDTLVVLKNIKGDTLTKWKLPKEQKITAASFAPNSKQVFTAHQNKTVRQYDIDQAINNYKALTFDYILPNRVIENDMPVESINAFANNWFITVCKESGIKFWNLENNYQIFYTGINNGLSKVSFAPDGKKFYNMLEFAVYSDVWQMNVDSSHFEKTVLNFNHSDTMSTLIYFDGKNTLSIDDSIRLLDSDFRTLTTIPIQVNSNIFNYKLSPDSEHFVIKYADTIQVFDQTGKSINIIKDKGADAFLSPDNQYVVSINEVDDEENTTARLFAVQSGKLIQTLKGHTEPITAISFSPDSKLLVTASKEGTAKVWNIQGEEIVSLVGHSQVINAVSFSPQGNYILTGSDDYTARLWNLNGEELKTYIAHKVSSLAFAPDGTHFVTAGTHDFNQNDFFNISMSKKMIRTANNMMMYDVEALNAKDKYTVNSLILWDINQDIQTWLNTGRIFQFYLTDYLLAGVSISPKTLLALDDIIELNIAGSYYLSPAPLSGVSQKQRLKYAEDFFEKSLEIKRSEEGVIGITNVMERQTEPTNLSFWDRMMNTVTLKKRTRGKFDVDEMLNTKDTDELQHYMEYIYDNKLNKAKNKADSLKYWNGLKKIAKKSLDIRQTPFALSTLQSANYVLGDAKENVKMTFNTSLKDMRALANFFSEKGQFKKQSLIESIKVFEYILTQMKPTSDDYKNAAKAYNELAWEQLQEKETIEAEKSITRGLELDKENRYLYVNQVLLYLHTNRNEPAKKTYLLQTKNDNMPNEGSFKESVREKMEKLESKGMKLSEATKKELTWLK